MRGAERTSAPAFTEPGRRVEGGLISPEASWKFTRRGAEEPSGFNTMDDFVYNLFRIKSFILSTDYCLLNSDF